MSLLLEALKKAEKAKEEAQRRARGDAAGAAAADAPASSDPDATVFEPARPVTTRAQLPDISAPLEIISDDLKSAPAAQTAPRELTLAEDAPAAAPPPPPPPREPRAERRQAARAGAAQASAQSAERATAQRVFEAKFKEPNPRLPFFITVAVLGVFAVATVVYFWIQLRPPAPLVNTNPVRPSDEKPVDTPAAAKPPASTTATEPSSPTAIPGLPGGSTAPAPAPTPTAGAGPAPAAPLAAQVPAAATPATAPAKPAANPAAAPRTRALPPPRSEERTVSINRGGPQIHPLVASGYAAYQAGDLAKAREHYQQALRDEPANRDALLGLAAVEMRAQRYDLADSYYQRILQADPRDPNAQAGMIALRGQQLDPVQVESRMKSLIAADRSATVLNFTLGNQYAQQGRWPEAQQAYFKAFATDPDNPDFAFNLAVSLDQLHQSSLALEYYRRALTLAQKRSASFSLDAARTRAQQLSR
jgi:tetratricopeptide (TPR) repeat protein